MQIQIEINGDLEERRAVHFEKERGWISNMLSPARPSRLPISDGDIPCPCAAKPAEETAIRLKGR
jgi:hypothetical protein